MPERPPKVDIKSIAKAIIVFGSLQLPGCAPEPPRTPTPQRLNDAPYQVEGSTGAAREGLAERDKHILWAEEQLIKEITRQNQDVTPKSEDIFPSAESEVEKYGPFALANRENLTKEVIVQFLTEHNAQYNDKERLAELILYWEEKHGIGAEYVLVLAYQETGLGENIANGTSPRSGDDNWLNYGQRDANGKFPDWDYDTQGNRIEDEKAVENNLETGFVQLHRYLRVWGIETNPGIIPDKDWKTRYTFADALSAFAPAFENRDLNLRIEQGMNLIASLRDQSKEK